MKRRLTAPDGAPAQQEVRKARVVVQWEILEEDDTENINVLEKRDDTQSEETPNDRKKRLDRERYHKKKTTAPKPTAKPTQQPPTRGHPRSSPGFV